MGLCFPVAAAVGDFLVSFAVCGQQWKRFWAALDRARLFAARACGHQIARQHAQEFLHQLCSPGFGFGLGDGVAVVAHGVHTAFEAQPFQGHVVPPHRLDHYRANEIVADQVHEELLLHHGRALAAQVLHLEQRFDVPEKQFDVPALEIELGDFRRRIFFRVQQGGHQEEFAGTEALGRTAHPDQAQGQFRSQPRPEPTPAETFFPVSSGGTLPSNANPFQPHLPITNVEEALMSSIFQDYL